MLPFAAETGLLLHYQRIVQRMHFELNRRWWVSDKHIPSDLRAWDGQMAGLLDRFLRAPDLEEKYAAWKAMIEHTLLPVGGIDFLRQADGFHCDCPQCQADLNQLEGLFD